ncbi:PQQ-binding-like beta-propeller repeat protein [Dactylosporangium sp. CS-033363]|uniref:outer membrane protein assembly factor BamB family protein n=1 Tax=Dactylosporangium sp. CS-033363 TaxID=3239935 RepID=UPI003D8F3382
MRSLMLPLVLPLLLVSASLAASPAHALPVAASGWPDVQGGPAHAGYQPRAGLTGAPGLVDWSLGVKPSRAPIVVDGALYVPETTTMRKLTPTGERLPFAAGPSWWIGQPVSDGHAVYAVTFAEFGQGELRSYAPSGAVRWSAALPGANSGDNTGAAGGLVVTTSGSQCRYTCAVSTIGAYDTATGHRVWQHDIEGEAGFERPTLTAGRVLWPTLTTVAVPRTSAAAAEQSPAAGWRLTALNARTGAEAWHAAGPGTLQGTAADDSTVYTAGNELCARALTDGKVRWCRADRAYDTVAVSPGTVYATSNGHLLALDPADGRPRWNAGIGTDPVHPPVIAGGMVMLHHSAGDQSALLVLAAKDGHRLSETKLGPGLPGMLTVAGGRVYAVHDYTGLVALRP